MKRRRKSNKIEVIERGLGREKCDGLAWIGESRIELEKNLGPKARLSTAIHELLHLCDETISESKVLKYEKIIADTLWEEGYRRVELE